MTELELLEKAASKAVLFAGETIVDRYVYVRPLGRPSKDAIISVERLSEEIFTGGVQAAAFHADDFAAVVDVISAGSRYAKTRFIEPSHMRKMFEFYQLEQSYDPVMVPLKAYDVVILMDYGHGMFTPATIPQWTEGPCIAVNVQTNSGNYGFNLATKYDGVYYLCVDEAEARLATQNRDGPIEQSLAALSPRAQKVVITLGKDGAIGYSDESDIVRCPAFTDTVVDTIGAGDAFFAITALVAEEAEMLSLLRIGNAAGAIKTGIIGHRKGVTKNELCSLLAAVPRVAGNGFGNA